MKIRDRPQKTPPDSPPSYTYPCPFASTIPSAFFADVNVNRFAGYVYGFHGMKIRKIRDRPQKTPKKEICPLLAPYYWFSTFSEFGESTFSK
jgi:hypothetical protein